MATTVINPTPQSSSNNGMGIVIGVLVLLAFVGLFLYFGLPYIQRGFGGGTQINVPKSIDINVNQPK